MKMPVVVAGESITEDKTCLVMSVFCALAEDVTNIEYDDFVNFSNYFSSP